MEVNTYMARANSRYHDGSAVVSGSGIRGGGGTPAPAVAGSIQNGLRHPDAEDRAEAKAGVKTTLAEERTEQKKTVKRKK
jgi:hypothetical protein